MGKKKKPIEKRDLGHPRQLHPHPVCSTMAPIKHTGKDRKEMYLGYLFTVFNYIFYCGSRFCKKKYQMLTLDILAKISTFLALFCLGSLSGAYSMMVSFLILLVSTVKERKEKVWAPMYVLFQLLLILILIFRFEGISSILVFLTSSVSLLSVWWLRPQGMRVAGLITSVTSLLYQLSIRNWAGLLEIFVICSNVLSYVRYRRRDASQ